MAIIELFYYFPACNGKGVYMQSRWRAAAGAPAAVPSELRVAPEASGMIGRWNNKSAALSGMIHQEGGAPLAAHQSDRSKAAFQLGGVTERVRPQGPTENRKEITETSLISTPKKEK